MVLGPAPLWRRFFAFIIDIALVNMVLFFPFQSMIENLIPTSGWESLLIGEAPANIVSLEIIVGVLGFITLLYFVSFESVLAQTPGKRLLNIAVVSETKPSFWRMVVRSLFVLPVFPIILLWIIDPLVMLFSREQKRILERLSKTRTVMNHAVE